LAAIAVIVSSCKGGREDKVAEQTATDLPAAPPEPEPSMEAEEDQAGGAGAAMALDESRMGRMDKQAKGAPAKKKADDGESDDDARDANAAPGGGEGRAATRSWFPETFLFEPLIVTDAAGEASVSVAVPDRLTTWRVLALAHSRAGAQAGAVTSFLGSLPAYVDPVTPPTLRAGDSVRLPIQVVNTEAKPLSAGLAVSAEGAAVTGGGGAINVGARSASVRYATLSATKPGEIKLSARLGQTDAVVKSIRAIPAGKPIRAIRGGTLAAPRSIEIAGPALAAGASDRVRLQVFPGALAIVRSELAAAIGRGGIAADAFALQLAGQAPGLLAKLGDEPDAAALRDLSILGTQRIVRHARTLDVSSASLLARAALAHSDNPILAGIGKRAVAYLASNQLPDGTCGGADGWTLQRLLVGTADCARAASAGEGARQVIIRASGAFERHAAAIQDPYTAAAILASGAATGDKLAARLRATVRDAAVEIEGGARRIKLPAQVVRADGVAPGEVEATAMAILGLAGDPESAKLRPDLGATLLASYSPAYGWGDGRANLVALEALLSLFDKPIERGVSIKLSMDGEVIASGELDAAKLRDLITLEAHDVGAGGAHTFAVTAEPAIAGLGFSLEVTTWVPWPEMERSRGLEIAAPVPADLAVGRAAEWPITAAAPAGEAISIELAPPAGVQIDRASLERLVTAGGLTDFQLDDDRLVMRAPPLHPGATLSLPLRVIPTLVGQLSSGPATIEVEGVTVSAPPGKWVIR
jgi:hypothetical protein